MISDGLFALPLRQSISSLFLRAREQPVLKGLMRRNCSRPVGLEICLAGFAAALMPLVHQRGSSKHKMRISW